MRVAKGRKFMVYTTGYLFRALLKLIFYLVVFVLIKIKNMYSDVEVKDKN